MCMGISRNMRLQPMEITHLRGAGGNNQKFFLPRPGYRQVRLDTTPFVEPLGIDRAVHGHINLIGTDLVQHCQGVPARHLKFGKRGLFEQRHAFSHRFVFSGPVLEPILSAITVFILRRGFAGRIPIRPLPPRRLAKTGAGPDQTVMQGRFPHAPTGAVLIERPMRGVEQAKAFTDAFAQITGIALVRQGTADIHVPQIHRRIAISDPFRHHLADAAR